MENSLPAIISKETFQAAQQEMERRQLIADKGRSRYTNKYPFSGKIFCGECGKIFTRKYWGTGKYKKPFWMCQTRMEIGPKGCGMPAGDEEQLREAFTQVVGRLGTDRESLVKRMTENIENVFQEQTGKVDIKAIDGRVEELRAEIAALVKLNLTAGINAEIYDKEYRRIAGEIDELRISRGGITRAETARQEMIGRVRMVAKVLQQADTTPDWDEELFGILVDRIRVTSLVQVEFVLKSGVTVTELL